MKRSSHYNAVEHERKLFGPLLEDLATQVRRAKPVDMSSLADFILKVDAVLAKLSDEHAVLKGVPDWPEARMDAMREATAVNAELEEMRREMREWTPKSKDSKSKARSTGSTAAVATVTFREAREECLRIAKAMDRIQRRVETLERTADGDARRFSEHGVPWDKGCVTAVRHGTLRLAEQHMRVCVAAAAPAAAATATTATTEKGDAESERQVRDVLASAVRFAFRVHQFAGGFNAECKSTFEEVKTKLEEVQANMAARERQEGSEDDDEEEEDEDEN